MCKLLDLIIINSINCRNQLKNQKQIFLFIWDPRVCSDRCPSYRRISRFTIPFTRPSNFISFPILLSPN